jgi:hypothetical protein
LVHSIKGFFQDVTRLILLSELSISLAMDVANSVAARGRADGVFTIQT